MSKAGDMPATATLRVMLLLVALGVLWALSGVVLLVFAAVLLAVALRGAAQSLARTGLPLNLSFAAVVILAFVGLTGFAWLIGPPFAAEVQQLVKEIYDYAGQMRQRYGRNFWVQMLENAVSAHGGLDIGPLAPRLLTVTFGTAGGFFLLIVTALYLAVSPKPYVRGTVLLVPPARRGRQRRFSTCSARCCATGCSAS
jgi:predicted PurR-regulated permease PerM